MAQASNQEDQLALLSQSKKWLQLLRYERAFFRIRSNASAIIDPEFFIDKNGSNDSYAELIQTIRAFQQPLSNFKNADEHPICKFPARYKWLKQELHKFDDTDSILPLCEKYNKWRANGKIRSISVYFATGYFGNPASFFGHPLLKFNIADEKSSLADTAINYGALTPENENPILYVFKGLLGGYSASFTNHDFYFHSHNYSETEIRDLWEYRLNLNSEEVEYFIDRLWELLGRQHPYFFLKDNCAYRIAELLEELFDQQLIFRNELYVIPIDLFINLSRKHRKNGESIVSEINHIPSRYSRMTDLYNELPTSDKNLVKEIIRNKDFITQSVFSSLPKENKVKILDTLINYYSFLKLKNPDLTEYNVPRIQILRERFKLSSVSNFDSQKKERELPPHLSQNTFNLQFAAVKNKEALWFQEFNLRPALYDELSPAVGHPQNSSLIVFDTRLRLRENKLAIRNLDLIRASNLDTPKTDLPEDGGPSWKFQIGLKSQNQTCENCLVGHLSGGLGYAREIFGRLNSYVLVKTSVQNNHEDQGTISLGPEIGGFLDISRFWKIFISYEQESFQNGLKTKFDLWRLEQRFGNSQNWDFRLEYQQRDDEQLRFNINWFL